MELISFFVLFHFFPRTNPHSLRFLLLLLLLLRFQSMSDISVGSPSSTPAIAAVVAASCIAAAAPVAADLEPEEQSSLLTGAGMLQEREARRRGQRVVPGLAAADRQGDLMLSLVDRLAPRQPTPEEMSRMSRGRLFFTQCVGLLMAFLFFVGIMSYSLSTLTQSNLAQILLAAFNTSLNRLAKPTPQEAEEEDEYFITEDVQNETSVHV